MLAGLLNQDVRVYQRTTYNLYGKAAWGTPTTYKARVEQKLKRRLDPQGEVIITNAKLILPPNASVSTDSKIVYGDITYRPIFINQAVGGDGVLHHISVEVAVWQGG